MSLVQSLNSRHQQQPSADDCLGMPESSVRYGLLHRMHAVSGSALNGLPCRTPWRSPARSGQSVYPDVDLRARSSTR